MNRANNVLTVIYILCCVMFVATSIDVQNTHNQKKIRAPLR